MAAVGGLQLNGKKPDFFQIIYSVLAAKPGKHGVHAIKLGIIQW